MKRVLLIIKFIAAGATAGLAQNVAINANGAAPHASAMLDISSSSKGLLIPRMTAAQRAAIGTPATGLQVYQTDGISGFYYYNGSVWTPLMPAAGNNSDGWALIGNAGTTAANFIGTTDKQNLVFKTNNNTLATMDTLGNLLVPATGKLGIGTATPSSPLQVVSSDLNTAWPTVSVINTGQNSRAADFYNANSNTTQPALLAYTTGKSYAAGFIQTNAGNTQPAVYANSSGGSAGYFSSDLNTNSANYAILKSEYTGGNVSGFVVAVSGKANSGTFHGTGGYFEGDGYGVDGYSQTGYAGRFYSPSGVGISANGITGANIK
ncbi:MAG TPA: hypothetical protein VLD19_00670, partial [Chitinophagaceae bacterium]|nr:hypothetical protein [Chitinophagaceae bacterium]